MDDAHSDAGIGMATEKEKERRARVLLRKIERSIPEPSRIKKWYLDYLTSDFTFASLSVAILLTIKVAFDLNWDKLWVGLLLWYLVFIAQMLSRITKTVSDYYGAKTRELKKKELVK